MSAHLLSRQGIVGDHSARIDQLFSAYDRPSNPGVNLVVVHRGAVIHQRGYGVANVEDDVPFTAQTVLRLGSTTKHLCATCLLMLEDRGLIGLDDDVRRVLPEVPDFGATITLRHLLTMTSGLRDGLNLLLFAGMGAESPISRAHVMRLLERENTLMFAPGDDFSYSNTNYALLSAVIERVAGGTIAQFMERELFAPLGMHQSALVPHMQASIPHAARGYVPAGEGTWQQGLMKFELCGDGGVVSTLEDMLRWFHHYRGDGGPRARLEAPTRLNDGRLVDYRLGINVARHDGLLEVSHAGGMPGFLCDFAFFPEEDLGIVLFANVLAPAILEAPRHIARIALARRTPHAGPPKYAPPRGFFASRTENLLIEIVKVDGVWTCYLLGEAHELQPVGDGTFASAKRGAVLTIRAGAGGVTLMLGCTSIAMEQVDVPRLRPEAPLERYEGRFWSPVLRELHAVTARDGRLEVAIDSPLRDLVWKRFLPVAADLFTSQIDGEPSLTNVQIGFRRDASGAVTGLAYNLARCRNVTFERRLS